MIFDEPNARRKRKKAILVEKDLSLQQTWGAIHYISHFILTLLESPK